MSRELTQKCEDLHKFSSNHRKLLEICELCLCFYCQKPIQYFEIKEWIDDDKTAICPNCGIDAVLPSSHCQDFNFLEDMNHYWFRHYYKPIQVDNAMPAKAPIFVGFSEDVHFCDEENCKFGLKNEN